MANSGEQTWFFIRGLVREAAHWDDFVDEFQQKMGVRTHCLELPGNGKYWRAPSPTSISEMASFVRKDYLKILEKEGKTPTYVFSISLGAAVLSEWMHQHPQDLSGAVLVNTSLPKVSPFYRRLTPHAWMKLGEIVLRRNPVERERQILALTTNLFQADDAFLQQRVGIYHRHPVSLANFLRQLRAAATYRPDLSPPTVPCLFLASEKDRLVHSSCTVEWARRWQSEIKIHPQAGHDLPLDDPEWTINAVQEWTKR